ncbi:MAG: hypothetical protein NC293_07435 [Roseburia sp.]|nr:hypothetical protein [Roseburia sp.]
MIDYKVVAEESDMIINGYAFTKEDRSIKVLNLNNPEMAIVFDHNCEILETTMSDIEIQIVRDYLLNNIEFMED